MKINGASQSSNSSIDHPHLSSQKVQAVCSGTPDLSWSWNAFKVLGVMSLGEKAASAGCCASLAPSMPMGWLPPEEPLMVRQDDSCFVHRMLMTPVVVHQPSRKFVRRNRSGKAMESSHLEQQGKSACSHARTLAVMPQPRCWEQVGKSETGWACPCIHACMPRPPVHACHLHVWLLHAWGQHWSTTTVANLDPDAQDVTRQHCGGCIDLKSIKISKEKVICPS